MPQQQDEFKNLYDEFQAQLNEMKGTVDQLKGNDDGKINGGGQTDPGADEGIKKLKELNSFLVDKEKAMQKALTKSRIETVGLKKICEDFKAQLNRQSKKT